MSFSGVKCVASLQAQARVSSRAPWSQQQILAGYAAAHTVWHTLHSLAGSYHALSEVSCSSAGDDGASCGSMGTLLFSHARNAAACRASGPGAAP